MRLDMPRADGTTLRDHMLAIKRMTGIEQPDLLLPTSPEPQHKWVWDVFTILNQGRQWNDGAPQAMSHQEILAWCTLNDEKLSKTDLLALRLLDSTWINSRNELVREQHGQ